MWIVWIFSALAQSPNSIEMGLDLSDWRALPENASVELLSEFMKNHSNSPLAELAWNRILQQESPRRTPRRACRAAQSLQHHTQALERTRVSQTIAVLHPAQGPLIPELPSAEVTPAD